MGFDKGRGKFLPHKGHTEEVLKKASNPETRLHI
jgi:hypothetical protein